MNYPEKHLYVTATNHSWSFHSSFSTSTLDKLVLLVDITDCRKCEMDHDKVRLADINVSRRVTWCAYARPPVLSSKIASVKLN